MSNLSEEEEEILKAHHGALRNPADENEEVDNQLSVDAQESEIETEDALEMVDVQQDSSDALTEEDSEPKSDLLLLGAIAASAGSEGAQATSNPEFEVEESAFGRKIRKRKKKMETRLLKEILNDVKVSNKRH